MSRPTLLFPSIDDYLGPGETRFFSRGYRRATYDVRDILVTPGDGAPACTTATVSIAYPRDWSTKADNVDLRPHLSTVDVFVLGVQLAEVHLTHTYGLSAADRRVMWLRRVTIRAGGAPQEELDGLVCSAAPRSTKPAAGGTGAVTVFDCRIGAMQVRCEFEHPLSGLAVDMAAYPTLDAALGPATGRYFGDGFKYRQQYVEDVNVDMAGLRGTASTRIEPIDGGSDVTGGTEAAYQPSVTMVDCFVVSLQLAQVLMYEMDSIARQESNTLWMLKTVLEAPGPLRPYTASLTARTEITDSHLVPLRGSTWRNVELSGELAGITLRCSFAHELPAGWAPDIGL